jgi:hypothetical protein
MARTTIDQVFHKAKDNYEPINEASFHAKQQNE